MFTLSKLGKGKQGELVIRIKIEKFKVVKLEGIISIPQTIHDTKMKNMAQKIIQISIWRTSDLKVPQNKSLVNFFVMTSKYVETAF